MEFAQRIPAFLAYILPVVGWFYVGIFHHKSRFATFHLRQSVGLVLFLLLITLVWAIITWVISWIPYAFIFGIALFTLPLTAYVFGAIAWVIGMVNALSHQEAFLPLIGQYSNRLPF